MNSEWNQESFQEFLNLQFQNLNGEGKFSIGELEGITVIFLTSLYCMYCIDLLPHLNEITKLSSDFSLLLVSDGNDSEVSDMIDFFKWDFPIISCEERVVNKYLNGLKYPFMIVTNENKDLLAKGTIYNIEDFIITTKKILNLKL
ncbi:hypothetical protein D3C76_348620 [compost metagenome]